jgi:hypothetical protein
VNLPPAERGERMEEKPLNDVVGVAEVGRLHRARR